MASALQANEEYALHDTIDGNNFDPFIEHGQLDNIHLASLAEKKRLWWRNGLINMAFISSWYVSQFISLGHSWSQTSGTNANDLQVRFRDRTFGLQ